MIKGIDYKEARELFLSNKEAYREFSKFLMKSAKYIIDYFNSHNTSVWCSDGTALGLVREGKMIDGDEDVDLTLDVSTLTKSCVQGLPGFLTTIGFTLKGGLNYKNNYVMSYDTLLSAFDSDCLFPFRNMKFVSDRSFSFGKLKMHAEIDIFIHYPLDEKHYQSCFPEYVRVYDKSTIYPIKEIDTIYGTLPVMNDTDTYLSETYGSDWKIPRVVSCAETKEEFPNRFKRRKLFNDIRYSFVRGKSFKLDTKTWTNTGNLPADAYLNDQ